MHLHHLCCQNSHACVQCPRRYPFMSMVLAGHDFLKPWWVRDRTEGGDDVVVRGGVNDAAENVRMNS